MKTLGTLALFASLASSHAEGEPMRKIANMFDPLSKPAHMIHESSLMALLVCAIIFLIVTGMLVYVTFKYRSKGAEDDRKEPPQIYGSSQIELAWTVIPVLITIVLILVTTRTIGEIQDHKVPENAVHVRVIGHQWWWEIHYQKFDEARKEWVTRFTIANEIHVPVNVHTEITLESADVLHSFWVAQLNGKTDLIPGLKNRTWIEPIATGVFFGNCAEYCGTQHANMQIKVFVQTQADFDKWVIEQTTPPPAPTTAQAIAGKQVFYANSCINCHKVDGTVAEGVFGPDLTHVASRMTIGAGIALNNTENLRVWMHDPATFKPGVLMPNMHLSNQQVSDVVAYLETLK
ncbi:MAG: cytochrome c oxidase subunit II [Chthoniobacterales bacterium]